MTAAGKCSNVTMNWSAKCAAGQIAADRVVRVAAIYSANLPG